MQFACIGRYAAPRKHGLINEYHCMKQGIDHWGHRGLQNNTGYYLYHHSYLVGCYWCWYYTLYCRTQRISSLLASIHSTWRYCSGCWERKDWMFLQSARPCMLQYQPAKEVASAGGMVLRLLWNDQQITDGIWSLLHSKVF